MTATERADTFGVVDDTEDRPVRRTALDFIRDMQAEHKAAKRRTVTLRDSERPEFELVCELPLDMTEVTDLEADAQKAAKAKDAPAEPVIAACMKLARFTRILRVRGQQVGDGDSSAFADPELQDTLGVTRAWRAVRQLFIEDGEQFDDATIIRLTYALQRKAGLDRADTVMVDEPDPT
jgi:hypothetical protein